MTAKVKCKVNPMTVTSRSPIIFNNKLNVNCPKNLYNLNNDNNSVGLLSPKSLKGISPTQTKSSNRTDHSSIILRQKLLHRHKNGSIGVSTNTPKSGRKSYNNRSQNNGFKFHNFVVNEDKRACLEEQHGTKKITVSHWKKSSNEPNVNEDCDESVSKSSSASHSILETLLAPNSTKSDETPRLNKRKPLHVRRVLRHELNNDLEQEEPLDLSFKRKFDFSLPENHLLVNNQNEILISESPTESVQHLIKSVNRSAAQASAIIASIKCSKSEKFSSNVTSNSSVDSLTAQIPINSSSIPSKQQKYRQTQRSLIKKQLEETFKQNGFLVKTKQVSDANNSAMFCKFRQLRKYTRYYLKSWHHHLPDEVNKLWKGFLPPKTEKPTSSHN